MSRRPLRATVAIAIPAVFTAALTSALLVGGKSTAVVLFDDTVSFGLALYATACAVLAARAATEPATQDLGDHGGGAGRLVAGRRPVAGVRPVAWCRAHDAVCG